MDTKKYNIIGGQVNIACDCDDALLQVLVYRQQPNTGTSHFDLNWETYGIQPSLPINIATQKVEVHPNKREPGRILNR